MRDSGAAGEAGPPPSAGATALARRILDLGWLWVALAVVVAALSVLSARGLYIQPDARVFFAEDNPDRVALDRFEAEYARDDNLMIVLAPEGGEVFAPEVLAVVGEITERVWQLPYVRRVDSITNIPHVEVEGDALEVRDLVPDPSAVTPEEAAEAAEEALGMVELRRFLVNEDGSVTQVQAILRMPRLAPQEEFPRLLGEVRALVDEIRARHPEIRIVLGGSVVIDQAFAEAGKSDAARLIPPMILLLLAIVGLALRSALAVGCLVAVIAVSALAGLGTLGAMGRPLNSVTVLAPLYILTLAVGSGVHILAGVRQAMRHHAERRAWAEDALARHMVPITVACLTTAVGFLSLNVSVSPPFREFGNMVAGGILTAWVLTLTLLPSLVTLLPFRRRTEVATARALMDPLAEAVIRWRRWLFPGTAALVAVSALGVTQIRFEDDFLRYFDERFEVRQAVDFIEDELTGLNMLEYPLESGSAGGINDPDFLAQAAAFVDWLRAQPEVGGVRSVTDALKRQFMHLHGGDPAMYRLPADAETAAQTLFLHELSLGYGEDLTDQITVDKSGLRVTASLPNVTTAKIKALQRRAAAWLEANAPAIETRPTGPTHVFTLISQRDSLQMLMGTAAAIVLISGIIALAFRSARIGALSLLPNLLPALVAFGLWGYGVGAVTLAISVVAASTLGIVVDDTVHFLNAYNRARRTGASPEDAIRAAFRGVGMALAVTTVALVAGYAVLAQSGFAVNGDMATLSGLTIAVALLADFLMLPGLLIWLDKRRGA